MHAFGLEETGDYARAERGGQRAIELEPRDTWAWHAVAHVHEMRNAPEDGIAWLLNAAHWSRDSFFAAHNWWHLALFKPSRTATTKFLPCTTPRSAGKIGVVSTHGRPERDAVAHARCAAWTWASAATAAGRTLGAARRGQQPLRLQRRARDDGLREARRARRARGAVARSAARRARW
ncbi:MAG: hypothetical protein U1F67_01760 [Rubrivivax sp.]